MDANEGMTLQVQDVVVPLDARLCPFAQFLQLVTKTETEGIESSGSARVHSLTTVWNFWDKPVRAEGQFYTEIWT